MNYVSQWKEPIWFRLLLLFCAKRSFYHTLAPNKERFFHKVLIYKNVNILYIFTHCFFAVHLCSQWKCIRKTWQDMIQSTTLFYGERKRKTTSGLQFSVEQAGSNCFAFYWHSETKVFWRTYNTLNFLLRLPRFRYHQKNLAYIANCQTSSVLFVAMWNKSCRSTKVRSYN